MLTKDELEKRLNTHPLVVPRLKTLARAEKINPDFRGPCISGGFLRNVALGKEPNDCDVVFRGTQAEQPGIVEAVRQAEKELNIEPWPDWDFENVLATGQSKDFLENLIGKFANHTDYLTMLLMDTTGKLYLGDEKTLFDIENRIFDLRFSGIEIWANHRGKGRTYASCLMGDLIRAFYLCTYLDLTPSPIAAFLMSNFDHFFENTTKEDQESRKAFWQKKTKGDPKYQSILDKFGVKSLATQ